MAAARRRTSVRSRPAPAGARRHQGHRPGESPVQRRDLHSIAGSDGAFTLYEDDGISNGYERGAFTTIPLRWSDATRTLTIGKRQGGFPGMLARRTFQVVVVRPGRPVALSFTPKPDTSVVYAGDAVAVKL
jgi:alpha-D-xyloside xylohydrolase